MNKTQVSQHVRGAHTDSIEDVSAVPNIHGPFFLEREFRGEVKER